MSESISHIALTVSQLARSYAFYEGWLPCLGYRSLHLPHREKAFFRHSSGTQHVILSPATDSGSRAPDREQQPGLHHLAFYASSRSMVDAVYDQLTKINATIVDPPVDCGEYSEGYYAVFFADPDGIRLEVSFTPNDIFNKPW